MNNKGPGRYMHGKTCAECRHFPRCQWLVGALKTWTYCDWAPPRFEAAVVSAEGKQDERAPAPEVRTQDKETNR